MSLITGILAIYGMKRLLFIIDVILTTLRNTKILNETIDRINLVKPSIKLQPLMLGNTRIY